MMKTPREIPKVIHQTWKDHLIPHEVYPRGWQDSWRENHPGWDYRLWSDWALFKLAGEFYPEFVDLMRNARGVVKADVGRLLVLHRFGGLYVDLDYHCRGSLEPLLTERRAGVYVSALQAVKSGKMKGRPYVHNALLAGLPGEAMFLALAKIGLERWQADRGLKPEYYAGPRTFTEFALTFDPVVLPAKKVCPLDWRTGRDLPESEGWIARHEWKHHW